MKQYLDNTRFVLENGVKKTDRTGTGTISVFGTREVYDLKDGFPLMTTKRVPLRLVFEELRWFLLGLTNATWLQERNVHIWDEWAKEDGDCGRIYGAQWRDWINKDGKHVDQIKNVLGLLQNDPDNRRILVVAYNPGEVEEQALPACHSFFQFYTKEIPQSERERRYYRVRDLRVGVLKEYHVKMNGATDLDRQDRLGALIDKYVPKRILSCQVYLRSNDNLLGRPFNIASYALLMKMIAHQMDFEAGGLILVTGDHHIYLNHLDQTREQLSRTPKALPTLKFKRKPESLFDYVWEDIELIGYDPDPNIPGKVAI